MDRIIILNRILYQKLIHFANPSKIRLDSCCCILYEIQIQIFVTATFHSANIYLIGQCNIGSKTNPKCYMQSNRIILDQPPQQVVFTQMKTNRATLSSAMYNSKGNFSVTSGHWHIVPCSLLMLQSWGTNQTYKATTQS